MFQHLQWFKLFVYPGEADPQILAKCNACYNNPCQHGGTCHVVEFKNFTCECTPGYHGNRCEQEINACFGNPCANDGICEVRDYGRFQ